MKHFDKTKYTVIIFREDLAIHYCDTITLEPIEIMSFKTLEEFEKYLGY